MCCFEMEMSVLVKISNTYLLRPLVNVYKALGSARTVAVKFTAWAGMITWDQNAGHWYPAVTWPHMLRAKQHQKKDMGSTELWQ